jgi:hypothetical protein
MNPRPYKTNGTAAVPAAAGRTSRSAWLYSGLALAALFLSGCAGGYVGGGVVAVDTDYYGPDYGGVVVYGHPGYDRDMHIASPPRQDFHGGRSAPQGRAGPASHAASGGSDRDRR